MKSNFHLFVLISSFITISRFENGKVVEEWKEGNLLGLMKQLGLMIR